VENAPLRVPAPIKKKGSKWTCNDLPIGCQDEGRFRKKFLPAWFKFCAQQDNPFAIPDEFARDAMQTIWDTTYEGYLPPHVITVDGPVFAIVSISIFLLMIMLIMTTL